jgi:ParB/RepB/Spo0J family partition protein
MPPVLTIQNISLAQVDFDDFSYSISPEQAIVVDESLKKSIARHGILHPPLVRETKPELYRIVSGRKRLHAMHSLHAEGTCFCLVISRQVPEVEVFHILLEENKLARQLSPIEKALFLQKISAIMDENQIAKEFLPRMGQQTTPFAIKQTLMLLNLEKPILHGIHKGHVNETVARGFITLSAEDRMVLFEIISSLRLSLSNQKKLLNICRELAGRGNTNIKALLDNDEVHGILHHQNANPPQKTKNLMTWLSRKHMPRSTQAEEEFNRFITTIKLPQNVSVVHTPFFEDDSLTLSIRFPNRNSLQHAWEKIRHATHNNDN